MVTTSQAVGALPAFAIAVLTWIFNIFVLNRFRGICKFSNVDLYALALFLIGGFAAWIAELCILDSDLAALQYCASLYRTFTNWLAVVLIVNGALVVTWQQMVALVLTLMITFFWELQHRIVLTE